MTEYIVGDVSGLALDRMVLAIAILYAIGTCAKREQFHISKEIIYLFAMLLCGVVACAVQSLFGRLDTYWFLLYLSQLTFNLVGCWAVSVLISNAKDIKIVIIGFVVGGVINIGLWPFMAPHFVAILRRYSGLIDNPNNLALYAAVAIFAAVTVMSWLIAKKRLVLAMLMTVVILLLFFVIDVTGSRGGSLAAILALLCVFFLATNVWQKFASMVAVAVVALMLVSAGYLENLVNASDTWKRIQTKGVGDTGGRSDIWSVGVEGIVATFPFGAGIGQGLNAKNFKSWSIEAGLERKFSDRVAQDKGLSLHNTYLDLMLEYGILGVSAFLIAAISIALALFRSWIFMKSESIQYFLAPVLLMMMLFGMTANLLLTPLTWVVIALIVSVDRMARSYRGSELEIRKV